MSDSKSNKKILPHKQKVEDTTIMWFGIHQGSEMQDVPADYLLRLGKTSNISPNIREYIDDNLEVLQKEVTEHIHNRIKNKRY